MASVRPAKRVALICGILAREPDWLAAARETLASLIDEPAEVSEIWPFERTRYYAAEMGVALLRQFVAFRGAADPGSLAHLKLRTNSLEALLAARIEADVERPVNLDPGYIALDKLVLATTKDYSHRLYLGGGIYGEVTLHYQKGGWRAWPWTYPDYADETYHAFFTSVRERLRACETSETPSGPQ